MLLPPRHSRHVSHLKELAVHEPEDINQQLLRLERRGEVFEHSGPAGKNCPLARVR